MKIVPFQKSRKGSIGIEIELQIVDVQTSALASRSKEILSCFKNNPYHLRLTPEVNQSTIELNTSIHMSAESAYQELLQLQACLIEKCKGLDVGFCGGGLHPEQHWKAQQIYPLPRYQALTHMYGYLMKQASVFGQHVHIGCANAEDSLYLTHAFARYIPQLIALSAASPFYESVDSSYCSTRCALFNSFPMSRVIPYLKNWQEFSDYFYKMRDWGIIDSMKDVYWDVRPKPEFGTVEIRIFDTPLTLKKTIMLAAYAQSLALYLLSEKPFTLTKNVYFAYQHNRFQACRYGFDAKIINTDDNQALSLMEDIQNTGDKILPYSKTLACESLIHELLNEAKNKQNDAATLRQLHQECGSFTDTVEKMLSKWLEK